MRFIWSVFLALFLQTIAAQPATCPFLQVRLSTSGLLACQEATYAVRYCNEGGQAAQNGQLTLELPQGMSLVGSAPSPQMVQGNRLTYALGTVQVGACGSILLRARVPCDAPLGATFCVKASVSPDRCRPLAAAWDGTELNVSARCQDSLVFTVRKNTTGPLAGTVGYIIIEDHIIFRQGNIDDPTFSGDTANISIPNPAPGKTYTFQMRQVPNHPIPRELSLSAGPCSGTATPGVVMQYPQYDGNPTHETLCEEVRPNLATNEKRGLPLGYAAPHYIEAHTELHYQIHFANEGNTPLGRVVVTDTLSPLFDLNTLRVGPASHAFAQSLQGRILTLTFDNLNLAPGAHGFVSLFVRPLAGLSLPQTLTNRASVAYGTGLPQLTNTTLHTIGEKFLQTRTNPWGRRDLTLKVFPNPASERVSLWLEGNAPLVIRAWRLFDMQGRLRREGLAAGSTLSLEVSDLEQGIYIVYLETIDGSVTQARIVVE